MVRMNVLAEVLKDLQHRPAVFAESQSVVKLHLSRQPGVVRLASSAESSAPRSIMAAMLSPRLSVKDGRVGHAQDDPAFQQRSHFPPLPGSSVPVTIGSFLRPSLGVPVQPVKLLDAVEPPALVRCIPPHRKRLREAEVVSPPDLPVLRDGENGSMTWVHL